MILDDRKYETSTDFWIRKIAALRTAGDKERADSLMGELKMALKDVRDRNGQA